MNFYSDELSFQFDKFHFSEGKYKYICLKDSRER